MLTFQVLGALEVIEDGQAAAAPTGKLLVLLAALLLRVNHVVSAVELIDCLWDQDPPVTARRTLRLYIVRLRKLLGPDVIQTRGKGYLVEASPDTLDLLRFRDLLSQAQRARAGADPPAESEYLRQALALWRRPVLADVASDSLRRHELTRLEEEWAQTTERRIEVDFMLGQHRELIAELSSLVAEFPLRERFHAQLMLALYRAGRQADALEAYRVVHHRLDEELGIEPGKELQDVHRGILAADPVLQFAAPSATPIVPRQLPPSVRGFTGRDAELARLDAVLAQCAEAETSAVVITAISGAAGVGKTAIAAHWAQRVANDFPDGQLWVNMRGYHPDRPLAPEQALTLFLRALGAPNAEIPPDLDALTGKYRSLIAGRRMLIVLDNADDPERVRPLLPGAPGCLVLVTSRDDLSGLVARDGATRIEIGLLSRHDSLSLLRRLLGSEPADADPGAVVELAEMCARLPLALRIAAERIATSRSRLGEAVAELRRQPTLDVLTAGSDPHSAARTVFSWSYRNLPSDAAALYRRLGLMSCLDWDTYVAAALIDESYDRTRSLLATLATAHLVEELHGRYHMHDLLRAYAAECARTEEAEAVRRAAIHRLFDYYLATATTATYAVFPHEQDRALPSLALDSPAPPLGDLASATSWLDAERDNLTALVSQAGRNGWHNYAIRFARTLGRYLAVGVHHIDARVIHRYALRAAIATQDRSAESAALHNLGMIDWLLGRNENAFDHYRRALGIRRQIEDDAGEASTLNELGKIYLRWGRYDDALDQHRHALVLYRKIGDRIGEADSLESLGNVYLLQARYDHAIARYQSACSLYREIGDRQGEANCLNGLGIINRGWGNYEKSRSYHQQALDLFQRSGGRTGEANSLNNLGIVAMILGQNRQAFEQHEEALIIRRRSGDRTGEANSLNELGNVHLRLRNVDQALDCHQKALNIRMQIGDRTGKAISLNELGNVYLQQGNYANALRHSQQALELAREIGQLGLQIHAHNTMGEVNREQGKLQDARAHHDAALVQAREHGERTAQARALSGLAQVHHDLGNQAAARRHWQEAFDLYLKLDLPEARGVQAKLERLL